MFFNLQVDPPPVARCIVGVIGADRRLYWSVFDLSKYLGRPIKFFHRSRLLQDVVGRRKDVEEMYYAMLLIGHADLLELLTPMNGAVALGLSALLKSRDTHVSCQYPILPTRELRRSSLVPLSRAGDDFAKPLSEWLVLFNRECTSAIYEQPLPPLEQDMLSLSLTDPAPDARCCCQRLRSGEMKVYFDRFPPNEVVVLHGREVRKYQYQSED